MKRLLSFVLLLCISPLVEAQTIKHSNANTDSTFSAADFAEMSIDDILQIKISVSNTVPEKIFVAPSSVSIIDRSLIERYNFLSVAEAVNTIAGLDVLQTTQERDRPTIRGILQNFYANKVLIMIDNTPTWQPIYGDGVLDRIDINEVERIEILKGPASVLYGTNAYTGVINIVLREPTNSKVYAQLHAGYPSYGQTSVHFNKQIKDFSILISGSSKFEERTPYEIHGSADSIQLTSITPKGIVDTYHLGADTVFLFEEEYRKNTFHVKLKYKNHGLLFSNFSNSHNYLGGKISFASGAGKAFDDRGTLIAYTYNGKLWNKTTLAANAHYDYYWRDYTFNAINTLNTRYSAYRVAANFKLNTEINKNLRSELGGEISNGRSLGHYIIEPITNLKISENLHPNNGISEWSAFAQLFYMKEWFYMQVGTRYTGNKTFGSNLSSRATSQFRLNANNTVKLVYAESFRTPNLLELYFKHNTVQGNANLKPEQSKAGEIVFQNKSKYFLSQITTYYTRYSNLIQRIQENPTQPATYLNLHTFDGYGLEVETKYENPEIGTFLLNYNYMHGRGETAASNYDYLPAHTLFVGVNKSFSNFFASINANAYTKTQGHLHEIPWQHKVDVHIGYTPKTSGRLKIKHTVSLKNITDSDMLVPEYIRKRPDVNAIATTAYGRRLLYSLQIQF